MHSFGYYFKRGSQLAKLLFSKRSFFDKLLLTLYFIGSLFGKFFFFTRPIFLIGDQNIALMLNEGHDVEVNKIFEGVNDKKRYSSLLLSNFFVDLIMFGAILIFVVPSLVFGLITPFDSSLLIAMIIVILGSIIVTLMYVALLVIYLPMGFVAAKGVDLSAGDILYLSKKATKGNKGLVIGTYIVYSLFIFLVLGGILGIAFLFYMLAINEEELLVIPAYVALICLPILEIFVITRFRVALVSSLYAIYSDAIMTKHVVISKRAVSSFEEYVAVFSDDKEEK